MASSHPKHLRPRNKFGDKAYEQFICEAYGCKPFEISVVKLSAAAINRIKMEIRIQNQMHDKKTSFNQNVAEKPCEIPKQHTPNHAPNDKFIKPRVIMRVPMRVPLPVQNVVICSMNHECKF